MERYDIHQQYLRKRTEPSPVRSAAVGLILDITGRGGRTRRGGDRGTYEGALNAIDDFG